LLLAGLLTYFFFAGLPVSIYILTVARDEQRINLKLTAAGTVPDFHRIPFLIPSISGKEPKASTKVDENKWKFE